MDKHRRQFLALAGLAPVALLASRTARAGEAAVCADPSTLSLSQKRQRRAIGYAEPSTAAGKACAGCAFFTAGTPAGCGTCQLLGGGPVAAVGVCNSFAAKTG